MNRAALYAAALALPLLGLGGMWISADRLSRQGTEWDVPIQGYDPRDLLQGHYVQFRYDWPRERSPEPQPYYGDVGFCLEGTPPQVLGTREKAPDDTCPAFIQVGEGIQGRLYVSQQEAARLQKQLVDAKLQGMVRIRLRPDGHITPLRLTFRPRVPEPQAAP
ncbi:MAG: GDYXXLXY domain-containing protein [Sphingomonadales bacterium]|nr:GDYXXLXY domain-containing protein [Sphingomonadales bacterium]